MSYKMFSRFKILFVLFALVLPLLCVSLKPAEDEKPHIIMILIDDLGWANVGYHREEPDTEVRTPIIDKLVNTGIELDRAYVN